LPDDLRVLAFDTSAAHCAAAVICGDRVLAQRVEPMAKGQAERLFPLLEETMAQAGLSWSDLDALGVGIGPGNFTGVRISVAAARGLALSLGIPAVGVSATEAAACDAPRPCRAVVALRGDELAWEDFPAHEEGALQKERLLPTRASAGTDVGDIVEADEVRDVVTGPAGIGSEDVSMLIHDRDTDAVRGGRLAGGEFGTARAARPLPPCDAQALPEAAGPKLGKTGELPSGPPVCLPVHPIAVAIGRVAGGRVATIREAGAAGDMTVLPRPAPLYLRPADAAPPKDPPPMILR